MRKRAIATATVFSMASQGLLRMDGPARIHFRRGCGKIPGSRHAHCHLSLV